MQAGSIRRISEGSTAQSLRQEMQRNGIVSSDCDVILRTATNILNKCVPLGSENSTQGLIYGNIQSGKTAVIIAVIALGLDNGYENFIVLTSDLNDLYQQTIDRIQSSLHGARILGKTDFKTPSGIAPNVPLIFVSSKNVTVLPRLVTAINQLGRNLENFLIIDDEADQASLNTNINTDEPSSGVNRKILELRNSLSAHSFLQTTATPQSLFLQDEQNPFKPEFVEVTQSGTGYIGGDHFFNDDETFNDSSHLRLVEPIDLATLKRSHIPSSLQDSLYVFFVGAAILRLRGNNKNYTYLLHTSLKQAEHTQAAIAVTTFVNRLQNEFMSSPSVTTMEGLTNAFNDLQNTFEAGNTPSLREVIDDIRGSIFSTYTQEVNASTGVGIDPSPNGRHTIYIGGTKIGRGVTVNNLLVTYYGRDAKKPQMDTVLQHARMYGYRQNELPAIRIYLPVHLAQRFSDIHASDNVVRELCQRSGEPISVLPLAANLNPTRKSVLNQLTVDQRAYVGGRQYFPRQPISTPSIVNRQTSDIDNLVSSYSSLGQVYTTSIDEILQILSFEFGTLGGDNGRWDDEFIRTALAEIKDSPRFENEASLVIVNRASSISRRNELTRAIIPGSAGRIPYGVNRTQPALLMTRLIGQASQGWDDHPFWVPVVRFPDGNYAFAVNYSNENGS